MIAAAHLIGVSLIVALTAGLRFGEVDKLTEFFLFMVMGFALAFVGYLLIEIAIVLWHWPALQRTPDDEAGPRDRIARVERLARFGRAPAGDGPVTLGVALLGWSRGRVFVALAASAAIAAILVVEVQDPMGRAWIFWPVAAVAAGLMIAGANQAAGRLTLRVEIGFGFAVYALAALGSIAHHEYVGWWFDRWWAAFAPAVAVLFVQLWLRTAPERRAAPIADVF